jgi:hypothetical protein
LLGCFPILRRTCLGRTGGKWYFPAAGILPVIGFCA